MRLNAITVVTILASIFAFTASGFPIESNPVIEIWYGSHQVFGHIGIPQGYVNILGNVSDPEGIASLVYSLNGGPEMNLSIGPDDRRLVSPGDFNVDILCNNLVTGVNQVVIKATDNLGNSTEEIVTIEYESGNVWPLPYFIDWSAVEDIQDVAQIVDGKWSLDRAKSVIRTVDIGYDRLVAIGDITWTDYEVTVPITVHGLVLGGPSAPPALGILMRWTGHTDQPVKCSQPKCGWEPYGAIGFWRWNDSGNSAWLKFFETDISQSFTPILGVPYIFKMRVEGRFYRLKVWEQGESEPDEWNLTYQADTGNLGHGSLMLLAHYADASFGNVIVSPILHTKELSPGWNLVSIPVQTTDNSLEHVLQSISDSLQSVWHYDSNNGRWKKYIKDAPPGFSDLDTIEPKKGYWINVTKAETLEITGTQITDTVVPLNPGWNLVGYPSLFGKPVDSALSSIFQQYLAVWAYNDKWCKHIKGAPPGFNDLESVEPWGGYWFNVSSECVWDINAGSPAPPLEGIVVKSPHTLLDMPKPPYILWGEMPVGAGDVLVLLKSGGITYSSYQLQNKGLYMLEVPSEVGGLELYVRVDGADVKVSPVPIGRPGEVIKHDISLNVLPKKSRLYQNYPNPFNPDTWIPYQLSEGADVVIKIYTSSGQLVRKLDLGQKPAGIYVGKDRSAYWDGRNEAGEQVSSGVYFYSISAGGFTETRKMVVTK